MYAITMPYYTFALLDLGEKKEEKSINGEKEDSVENGEDEGPEDEEEMFYDKNKSFFDNISCEATERAKGLVKTLFFIAFFNFMTLQKGAPCIRILGTLLMASVNT